MRHLKSYAAPKSWTLLRKIRKWVLKPLPGAHPLDKALPIGVLLKQVGVADTTKEARKIINQRAVLVDGIPVKDVHFATGFMDGITIKPDIILRGTLDEKGRLKFVPVPEVSKKISKIIGKTSAKGGKVQLNLSDGRNVLVDKGSHKTGDSLLFDVPSQKIVDTIPLDKGVTVFLVGGKHTGTVGIVAEIQKERIWITKDKEKLETLKKFAFVIGKDKPLLKL